MPRTLRLSLPPGLHHVTSRGNNREPLFRAPRDHLVFYGLLRDAAPAQHVQVLAHCLMPNHFHLLVDAGVPQLSRCMQRVKGRYAAYVNTIYGRTGHVFEKRFHAVPILGQSQLAAVVRYIARNPVAAGLCEHPEEWEWGSAHLTTPPASPPPWLASQRLRALLGDDPSSLWRE